MLQETASLEMVRRNEINFNIKIAVNEVQITALYSILLLFDHKNLKKNVKFSISIFS